MTIHAEAAETWVDGYRISTNSAEMNLQVIHAYVSRSYWAQGIPMDILKRAVQNSLCFGVFTSSGEQVGFARVITDSATFAYLADVFILEEHRGKGLSKLLMKEIMAHPSLQGLRRFNLSTRDAHSLYERFGFTSLANPQTQMEIVRPDIYQGKQ